MPVVHDWGWGAESFLADPLGVSSEMFEKYYFEDPATWDTKLLERCNSMFAPEDVRRKLPQLNRMENHVLMNRQVVRFRCMIQDMFDPELYLGVYQVRNLKSGETKERSTLFRDKVYSQTFEEPLVDDKSNKIMERRLFYCISVPGENEWVERGWLNSGNEETGAGEEGIEGYKGQLDGERRAGLNEGPTPRESHDGLHTNQSASTQCTPLIAKTLLNFPLPEMFGHGKGCIAIVYDAEATLAANDVCELVGILSLDSFLDGQDRCEDSDPTLLLELGFEAEAVKAHNPPTSLIPRLHVISLRKLLHINPAVPLTTPLLSNGWTDDAVATRRELKNLLVDVFLGDDVCAEYVLLNLISRVCSRNEGLAIGNMSLNLETAVLASSSLPSEDFSALVYKVLRSLVPKSFLLDLNLDSLNTSAFIPTKCYTTNRLKSGILQLSEGTHLLIDDKVEAGGLNGCGLANLFALKAIASSQKIDYDFQFHKLPFLTDIPIIILSDRKSIVQCDVVFPIRPAYDAGLYNDAKNRINSLLEDHTFMTRMRNFLTIARAQDSYSLEEPMQLVIEEDFKAARRQGTMTADELHILLTVSRLLCQTLGKERLEEDTWRMSRGMEQERKYRLDENRHN